MVLMRWCILMYKLSDGKAIQCRCWMVQCIWKWGIIGIDEDVFSPMNWFVGFTEFLRSTAHSIHHRKDQEGCSTISLHRGHTANMGVATSHVRALNFWRNWVLEQDWRVSRNVQCPECYPYWTGVTLLRCPDVLWQGLKRDGFEVLYMTDPVDEYAVQFLKDIFVGRSHTSRI